MILRISKMLVMMALPIVLIACGGEKKGPTQRDSGMRFVPVEGTVPSDATAGENLLSFGNENIVGLEKGPVKFNLTNITNGPVTFGETGLLGGSDDIFITASSCFDTLAANDSCEVSVTLSPKEQNRSYKDEYSVIFSFNGDINDQSLPVILELSARTFQGEVVGTEIPGLSVSKNYQSIKFDNVTLGNTAPAEIVQYYYFGDDEVLVNPTESVVATSTGVVAGNVKDGEIAVESDCGVLRYGDSCSVQLFYRPAIPSNEIVPAANIYSHLNVSLIQNAAVSSSTIKMQKESYKPADSVLMEYHDNATNNVHIRELSVREQPAPGQISNQAVALVRTTENSAIDKLFYRLESTNSAIQVERNKCDLLLVNPGSDNATHMSRCEFNISFSSSGTGEQVGYVIAVAGDERTFLKVKGSTTAGNLMPLTGDQYTQVGVASSGLALATAPNTLSATKRMEVRYIGSGTGEEAKPFSIKFGTVAGQDKSLFSYTTTCIENKALTPENPVCYIDVNFRGKPLADIATDADGMIEITVAGAASTNVHLLGKTIASVTASTETPVDGLSINAKSFVYPTTGIGLVSQTFAITLTNNNAEDISGLGTTSTDLATFTLNNGVNKACVSTLTAGADCTLGYVFRPRNSLEKTSYISIFDNRTATELRNNEIIQVVGRGTLFNEYLSFGVVAQDETKTLVAAFTNDGVDPLVIDKVMREQFTSEWDTAGFTDTKDLPTGNRVALIKKYFNRDNFTNTLTPDASATINILSSECDGLTLDPGASCLMRLEFAPTVAVNTTVGKEHENHYRAYLNVKDADNKTIDRLHVIGSTQDNSTMYMYPEQDFNQALGVKPTIGFEKDDNVSTTTLERNFVVIGNDVYSYLGSSHQSDEGSLFKGDNKLRKYDASRNKWVILNPAGTDPFNISKDDNDGGKYGLAMQSKLIAYDGKLYLYPLGFDGHRPSYRYDLYVYDPNIGVDGKWTNLGPAPDSNQHTYISMSAYKGKIYFFGGDSEKNRSEVTEYDIADNTYKTLTATGTKPRERNGPALIVSEIVRKSGTENLTIPYLIVHGGAGIYNSAAPAWGQFRYGLNDLWAFELPRYDEEGKEVIRTETYTWTELQKNTPRLVVGSDNISSTDEAQTNVESDLRHIENRPADRGVHVFNYYDNKLFLTSGRDGTNDPLGGTHNGKKGLLYTLDPAELFNDDPENTTCSTVSMGTGDVEQPTNTICDAFTVYEALKTDYLNFNFSETLSGDLWFHNWNILGVFFNKSLESATR